MSIKAKETLWFNFSSKPLKEDITDTSRNRLLIHILAGNLCKLSFTETTRQRKQYLKPLAWEQTKFHHISDNLSVIKIQRK